LTLCDGGAAEEGTERKAQSRVAAAGCSDGKDWTDWIDRKMSRMCGRVGPGIFKKYPFKLTYLYLRDG